MSKINPERYTGKWRILNFKLADFTKNNDGFARNLGNRYESAKYRDDFERVVSKVYNDYSEIVSPVCMACFDSVRLNKYFNRSYLKYDDLLLNSSLLDRTTIGIIAGYLSQEPSLNDFYRLYRSEVLKTKDTKNHVIFERFKTNMTALNNLHGLNLEI